MNDISKLSDDIISAIQRGEEDSVRKQITRLESLIPPYQFQTNFMAEALFYASRSRNSAVFEFILAKNTRFDGLKAKQSFAELFNDKEKTPRIAQFLKAVKDRSPAALYKEYDTTLYMENVVKLNRVDLLDQALNKEGVVLDMPMGARDARGDFRPYYVILAINYKHYEILEALLERGIKGHISTSDIIYSVCGPRNTNPERYIDLLARYGKMHLTPHLVMDVCNTITYNLDPYTIKKVESTLIKWLACKKHQKFFATFKQGATYENLKLSYTPTGSSVRMTALHGLAYADRFKEAVEIAKRSRASITQSDLMMQDSLGNNIIDILGSRGCLDVLDDPDLWKNNEKEYYKIRRDLPSVYRKQLNKSIMRNAFMSNRLKKPKPQAPRLKRRPKENKPPHFGS